MSLRYFTALLASLLCCPSSLAAPPKGWDKESCQIMKEVLMKSDPKSIIEPAQAQALLSQLYSSISSNLSQEYTTFELYGIPSPEYKRLRVDINSAVYHICYGDSEDGIIYSGGHLGCMKKFQHNDVENKAFFSESYQSPNDIRNLIIREIKKVSFKYFNFYDYSLSSKKHSDSTFPKKIYKGSIRVPGVGTTINGRIINYLEFVVYYDCSNKICTLATCYPKLSRN